MTRVHHVDDFAAYLRRGGDLGAAPLLGCERANQAWSSESSP